MLTSHRLLQQYWHDYRYDLRHVRVWYSDRGAPAPDDHSMVSGSDISLEPYYFAIRTLAGRKETPYHRILFITYDSVVLFENRKSRGLAGVIAAGSREETIPGP